MRIKIASGVLAAFGIAFIVGAFAVDAIDTLSTVPASSYAFAGLIPAMLAGQLIISRKRSRR
jgi:hypothetical protein